MEIRPAETEDEKTLMVLIAILMEKMPEEITPYRATEMWILTMRQATKDRDS